MFFSAPNVSRTPDTQIYSPVHQLLGQSSGQYMLVKDTVEPVPQGMEVGFVRHYHRVVPQALTLITNKRQVVSYQMSLMLSSII